MSPTNPRSKKKDKYRDPRFFPRINYSNNHLTVSQYLRCKVTRQTACGCLRTPTCTIKRGTFEFSTPSQKLTPGGKLFQLNSVYVCARRKLKTSFSLKFYSRLTPVQSPTPPAERKGNGAHFCEQKSNPSRYSEGGVGVETETGVCQGFPGVCSGSSLAWRHKCEVWLGKQLNFVQSLDDGKRFCD